MAKPEGEGEGEENDPKKKNTLGSQQHWRHHRHRHRHRLGSPPKSPDLARRRRHQNQKLHLSPPRRAFLPFAAEEEEDHNHFNDQSRALQGGKSPPPLGRFDGKDLLQEYDDDEDKRPTHVSYANGMPPLQHNTSAVASSSGGLRKKNVARRRYDHNIRFSPQPLVRDRDRDRDRDITMFRGDPLLYNHHHSYGSMHLDSLRGQPLSPPVTDDSHDYVYIDVPRRDHGLPGVGSVYKLVPRAAREDYLDMAHHRFADPLEIRDDELDRSPRFMRNTNIWDHPSSPRDGLVRDYRRMKKIPEEYMSEKASLAFRTRPPYLHPELIQVETDHGYGSDDGLDVYRGGSRSPVMPVRFTEICRSDMSPYRRANREDINLYDSPYDRVSLRKRYVTDDDLDCADGRVLFQEIRGRPVEEYICANEPWTSEERTHLASSKGYGREHSQSKMHPRRVVSKSDAWFSHQRSDGGSDINNVKKRPMPEPSHFQDSFSFNKRRDFNKPYKFMKNFDDRSDAWNGNKLENTEDRLEMKSDHQEDTKEFEQHVHKAFLRFSKLLNQDSHQRKRYLEQGKAGSLFCCVCGSQSKEFWDTHSLIMHAYTSLKFRLRADHLGFHKALCALMGWNWLVAPDNGKLYQSTPTIEAKALKEDLILWPPVVIVHNSSTKNKSNGEAKVIDNEGMIDILRGIGVGAGKARVFQGKPANQNVLLVKFLPTFSGLQEAEKLHEYYVDNKRGRREFQLYTDTNFPAESQVEKLLYGYMGTLEDMDNLDQESKKRCVIKSKKDIDSIADAPLTAK